MSKQRLSVRLLSLSMAGAEAEPVSGWAGAPSERGHFRPDIEGLRAVAVLLVLLFHVGVPGFAGGFVGVDVFYVISGFLITGLLRREFDLPGRINLVAFYERRARRLLPAALVVIGVTVVAASLLLPRLRSSEIAFDAAAAAAYVSNYRFALQGLDYLTDPSVSPLLHYWSLGVEEQFYLIWPLFILVGARLMSARRVTWLIIVIGVATYLLAIVLTTVAAPVAFFSLPTRAWELAIGAALAYAPEPLSKRVPRWGYWLLGWLGLLLILAAGLLFDRSTVYPDTVALLPTSGAALVIAAGGGVSGGVARPLSAALPRWFGRISYSLYLWHWPLLVLAPLVIRTDALAARIGLGVVSVAVAYASTRWIEDRFRQRSTGRLAQGRRWRVLGAFVGASALLAAVSGVFGVVVRPPTEPTIPVARIEADVVDPSFVLAHPDVSGPVPDLLLQSVGWASHDVPPSKVSGCQVDKLGTDPSPCIYGDPQASTTVALFGDSHAGQWLSAMIELANRNDWRLESFTKPACAPFDELTWDPDLERGYRECLTWVHGVLDTIARDHPAITFVATASKHELYLDQQAFTYEQRPAEWRTALANVLGELSAASGRVVLIADTPLNSKDPLDCLTTMQQFDPCETSRSDALDVNYGEIEVAATTAAGAQLLSLDDLLCSTDVCPVAFGDYLVYRDSQHLTSTFARLLSTPLQDRLDALARH